jgi:integrase
MRQAKVPSYILLRGGVFYVRMSVPSELRPVLGKIELKRSLNTKSRSDAALLAPPAIASFQRQLAEAAAQCTPVHPIITEVPMEDAREFVRRRVERMQALPDQSRARGRQFLNGSGGAERAQRLAKNKDLLGFFEEIERAGLWDSWRTALGRSTVHAYEAEHSVQIAPQSIAHGLLSDLGAQVEMEHLRRAIFRDEHPHNNAPAPNSSPALASGGGGMGMAQLLHAHRAAKETTWKPASSVAFVKVERLLTNWFGRNRMVADISREQWRELINLLPRIPTGYTRVKAFKGLTIPQVIEAADAMPVPALRLSAKTCGDYAIQINSLLNWATTEEHLFKNLAKDLSPPRDAREGRGRRQFEGAELQRLFTCGPYAPGMLDRICDGQYWLPLLALFTGMRSGEIAGLRVRDIVTVRGVVCFRLTDAAALKSKQSVRDIPLHSELRRLGFLDFVAAKAQAGEAMLFADIKANGKKDQSSEFSKVFRKALKAAGLDDPTISMHAFRHTFAHALVDLRTSSEVAEALHGWGGAKPRNMFAHYGGRPPIQQLADTVERVAFPGLDLSHLHTCSTTAPTARLARQFD